MNDSNKAQPMNASGLIASFMILFAASVLAAPGERIDPKTLKQKISLRLGAKGTIQFKQEGDTLKDPTLVKDAPEQQPGIAIDFKKHEGDPLLILQSRFPKALKCRAAIRIKGRKDYVET